MVSKQQLFKEVSNELGWTQADVQRAVGEYGDVSTKEEVYACCMRYAGPELKKRNYERAAQKRINTQSKETINNLVDQLTSITFFYQNQLVPTLRATIAEQAGNIKELLRGRKSGSE